MNQAKDMLYKEKSWCVQWGKHGAVVGTARVEKPSLAHCQEHGIARSGMKKSEVKFYVQQLIKEAKNWL